MKKFAGLFLVVAVIPAVALASTGIDCRNQATGAEFHVSVYADQAPHFSTNSQLAQAVSENLPAQGDGGDLDEEANLVYTVNVNDSGEYLSLDKQSDGGYLLTFAGTTFYFHPNECTSH